MDIKAKSEDLSKKINAISEKLGLSEDLCCTGDELLPTIKEHYNIDEDTTIDDIKEQPTADVAPVRHGYWIENKHTDTAICSECKCVFTDETNYCPKCGAKMDER